MSLNPTLDIRTYSSVQITMACQVIVLVLRHIEKDKIKFNVFHLLPTKLMKIDEVCDNRMLVQMAGEAQN